MRAALAFLLLSSFPLTVAAQPWVEGMHYASIPGPYEAREDGRIEVAEVFWYGCPSCNALEPQLLRWLDEKPDDVAFVLIAAELNPAWRVHTRAFHTAESLGVTGVMHARLYHAIHVEQNPLNSEQALAALFAAHAGTDPEEFQRAYQGFDVERRVRAANALARRYRARGVPTLVVNRRWRTDLSMVNNFPQMLELVDHLVEMERRAAATE